MKLTSISLQNFRSYTKRTFTISPDVTLIVGENAAGKTNVLEAIMVLATGKSFRADQDAEMMYWGEKIAYIVGKISGDTKLEVQLTQGELQGHVVPKKRLLVNDVPRRSVDFVGNCRAVLFWPQDLELVTDSPSIRRKYLDTVLVQVDREYRRNLNSYERGLRQRNRLLDQIKDGTANRSQLLFWNQFLIRSGNYLTDKRREFIEYLNEYRIQNIEYRITYDKSIISESRLEQYKDEEIAAKATLVGPHRDDFVISKIRNNELFDLSKYGSRGEQRLAVLWMKLRELSYIELHTGDRPMLLLDDIFSELDSMHRELIWNLVSKQQTVISSADPHVIPKSLGATLSTIHV